VAAALTEIDHGPDENQPEEAVIARIGPEALRLWEEEAQPPPGWAVDPAAAAAAWRALLDEGVPGETRLIVTSNGVARFGLMAYGRGPLPKLRTGAYGVITFEDGTPQLQSWDQRP
jgi:probable phosphoglycerate mutase